MQRLATRGWITAGAVLAGVGVIAVTPITAPLPGVFSPDIQLATGSVDITLDFVRHGESTDNVDGILGTAPPGAALTDLGEQQAHDVAVSIHGAYPNGIDGIYASDLIRTQETAEPLAQLLGMDVTNLAGLDELNAGLFEGQSLNPLTELGYLVAPVMWMLGLYFVPQLGSGVDPNGMAFENRVNDALQTIYASSLADPDATDTNVAFSHGGTIAVWTLMNVKNPDFSVVLNDLIDNHVPLANTGQVILEGNPTDGWTLISWDGVDVPQDPGLGTELFVDFRDLITAPQMALWQIWEAIAGGDPTAIMPAIEAGLGDVGAALTQFPGAVFNDIADALGNLGSDAASATAADLVGEALA